MYGNMDFAITSVYSDNQLVVYFVFNSLPIRLEKKSNEEIKELYTNNCSGVKTVGGGVNPTTQKGRLPRGWGAVSKGGRGGGHGTRTTTRCKTGARVTRKIVA